MSSSSFKPTKITTDKFTAIKDALDHTCLANETICHLFGIGKTTLQSIKQSANYDAYKQRMAQSLARKKAKVSSRAASQSDEPQLVVSARLADLLDKLIAQQGEIETTLDQSRAKIDNLTCDVFYLKRDMSQAEKDIYNLQNWLIALAAVMMFVIAGILTAIY